MDPVAVAVGACSCSCSRDMVVMGPRLSRGMGDRAAGARAGGGDGGKAAAHGTWLLGAAAGAAA